MVWLLMSGEITTTMPQCLNCRYEASLESGEWNSVEVPPLGDLTQCPECGSTNIRGKW
jgi:hypothetical protein